MSCVEFVQDESKINVMIGGKFFTSYLYGDELTKPILFPVHTTSGIMVNRGYPLMEVEGEVSKDHPHHFGIFFTYDKVNEDGFWNNVSVPPQIKHIKVKEMVGGTDKGTISTVMHWVGKSGSVLLQEERTMVFHSDEGEYIIDFDIKLTAQQREVVFGDTKEGMFAIRAADWLREAKDERSGTGMYLNCNGDQMSENVWGKRARWVRLQGEKHGKTIGIAIFNHPVSVNYPTYWHARGYGLFSANPLGQFVFQKRRGLENPQPFNLTLQPGEIALFKFRMIIYEGARTKEQIEARFSEFVE